MRHNVSLLKSDIVYELSKLDSLIQDFVTVQYKLDIEQLPVYDRAAIGYYIHSYYNGCENIFTSIARFFENDLSSETWHSDVLKRMKLKIEGYRPAVISEELFLLLNDFRSFRHVFRHSYTFELDWEKESIVAKKLIKAHKMLQNQINLFLIELEKIES
ncbi:MAG: antitoxin [Candidatus Brocadiae bacterium]|nr:antitoxin [Candidatus Brocadiia bacterium]